LNGKGPRRGLDEFGCNKLVNLLLRARDGHFIPAVVRHSVETPSSPFMSHNRLMFSGKTSKHRSHNNAQAMAFKLTACV
jgi:hypothetical protein